MLHLAIHVLCWYEDVPHEVTKTILDGRCHKSPKIAWLKTSTSLPPSMGRDERIVPVVHNHISEAEPRSA